MSAVLFVPKFNMPAVYRPKNENCFRCKVGFHITKSGKRERREFRLGDDELAAHKKALLLAEKWLRIEERHIRMQNDFHQAIPEAPPTLPVWTDLLDIEAEMRREYLNTPPDQLPGDEDHAVVMPSISIQKASLEFLGRMLEKAKRDAKALATYRWYEQEFRLGLVPGAIDPALPVNIFALAHVEQYCGFWCDLESRAAESKRKTFGWRTATNHLDAFAFLLRDLKGRVPGFVYPERADAVFNEAKKTLPGDMTPIQKYDPVLLKSIIAGNDWIRMMIYCALNFAMYQSDIGQQLRQKHTEDDGGPIEIEGEMYIQWHRHKLKRLRRAMMRATNGDEKPVLLTHYTWPETLALLNRFAAPDNKFNLWLLNKNGLPLWRQELHYKRALDSISPRYHRVVKALHLHLPFDQLRKFGATACESLATIEVQEMYRGERRTGSSRVYVLKDYVGKLTPALKAWADRLRADGVLY